MGLSQPPQAAAAVAKSAGEAVKALLKWKNNQSSSSEKGQLLPGADDYLYLYLTLEKIPQESRTKPFKIPLPHSIYDSYSEFCLIVDDRRNQSLKEDLKKVIKSQNLPITKVLKLSKLEANYKPHEAKRKLCESYDAFLVDRNIVHLLPKLLGKSFFLKKKLPLSVDLSHKNFKEQFERVYTSGLLYVRTGTCCVMKVAKMEDSREEEIVENVVEGIEGVVKVVPKGWSGVRSLHLKVSGSLALPVYQALPDVKLRIEGLKESEGRSSVEKNRLVESDQETEKKKKSVKPKKKKGGRIHEVKYMDPFGHGDEILAGKEEVNDEVVVSEKVEEEVEGDNHDGKAMENGGGKRSKGKASLKKSASAKKEKKSRKSESSSDVKKAKKAKRGILSDIQI